MLGCCLFCCMSALIEEDFKAGFILWDGNFESHQGIAVACVLQTHMLFLALSVTG